MLALIGCTHEKGSITSKEDDANLPVINSTSFMVKTPSGNFKYTSFATPSGAECTFRDGWSGSISCK